ncbi:MAG: hypothetical protein WC455_17310 [Dehalococcoidia bacterium]|jgi:hypothetical protein
MPIWFKSKDCDHPLSARIVVSECEERCRKCGERFFLVAVSYLKERKGIDGKRTV